MKTLLVGMAIGFIGGWFVNTFWAKIKSDAQAKIDDTKSKIKSEVDSKL